LLRSALPLIEAVPAFAFSRFLVQFVGHMAKLRGNTFVVC